MIYIRLIILLAAWLCTMSSALAATFNLVANGVGQELSGDDETGEVGAGVTLEPGNIDIGIDHTAGTGVVITIRGTVLDIHGNAASSFPIKSADANPALIAGVRILILDTGIVTSQDAVPADGTISAIHLSVGLALHV